MKCYITIEMCAYFQDIYVESKFADIFCYCVVNKNTTDFFLELSVLEWQQNCVSKVLSYPHKNCVQYDSCVHICSQMYRVQEATGVIIPIRGNV